MSALFAARSQGKSPGFVTYVATAIREEGFLSLYEGLGAGITRQIFYATSRFGLFEVFRDALAKYRETDLLSRLFVGSGVCTWSRIAKRYLIVNWFFSIWWMCCCDIVPGGSVAC
jgi:hypothetical protein